MINPHVPLEAEIIARIEELPHLVTLQLRLTDEAARQTYRFRPGQFNMLYLHGAGEVPITITSDPDESGTIDHTIRGVGRVTSRLVEMQAGERLGLRGPYGRGWPLDEITGRDIVFVTGGLGCAPVVGAIEYIAARRERYGRLNIMQGVKHVNDFIWKERYEEWRKLPGTKVLLAADVGDPVWPWHIGLVSGLYDQLEYDPGNATIMMCGPEGMMHAVTTHMLNSGVSDDDIWLSMERNMQCAVSQCGHCQHGPHFVCREGPIFSYRDIKLYFNIKGF